MSERIEPNVAREGRYKLVGRGLAGAFALACLVATAVQLDTPLNGHWMRLVLLPLTVLLTVLAFVGEDSRATFLAYKATVGAYMAAFVAQEVLPHLAPFSAAYLVLTAVVVLCGLAALAKSPLQGWRPWLLAGSAAAALLLPLLRERLGPGRPPLPGYLSTALYTCELVAVAGLAIRLLLAPRRSRSA